jgi:hypothetical protein
MRLTKRRARIRERTAQESVQLRIVGPELQGGSHRGQRLLTVSTRQLLPGELPQIIDLLLNARILGARQVDWRR